MLEAGLRQRAVELQAGIVVGQAAIGAGAEPGGEAAFFGDGSEGVVGFAGAEREVLAAGLPAQFLNEQFGKSAAMEERAGALEVEGHSD